MSPLGDLIQFVFHRRGEAGVDHVREISDQHVVHREPDLGRQQALLFADDVSSLLDRGQDRRVGRRTSDVIFLERLDQRGLGVAGRGLGEMLFGENARDLQRLPVLQGRHRRLPVFFLGLVFVPGFLINRQEPLEAQYGSGCP